MRWTVKLVLCFLMAWLPMAVFAAPVPLCPHVASLASAAHAAAQHATAHHDADLHAASPASAPHQPACHGSASTLSCSLLAVPVEMFAPGIAAASPDYAPSESTLPTQFIPDLPQPPPRIL